MSDTTLYFAYASFLDPNRIESAAPGAKFLFTAHYPETRMAFVDNEAAGPIPTLVKESGNTVWGGVFEIPSSSVASLSDAEHEEGRISGFDAKAVDREGNKYECLTYVANGSPRTDQPPNPEYLELMIQGARHWDLPAGWVLGLEDLNEDPLFS